MRTRSGRFAKRVEHLDTEEASKSALVLPFLQMLGYEIFDPTEVVPEFIADVGAKKGEKVDYAVMRDGAPVILIEAKKYGNNLDEAEISQLLRYSDEPMSRYWVYENWTVDKARPHRAECPHCNDGRGKRPDASVRNGRWHGPFGTRVEAESFARATRRRDIGACRYCIG